MIQKIPIKGWTRDKWLEERRKSLGGSDMGAVLGLNPFSSPYLVYMEKTGAIPDQEDNEAMRQGRDLEEYVAKRFSEASGKKLRRVNAILRNTDSPHLHANVDRVIIGEDSGVECKTASANSEKKFTGDTFPKSYYAQCVTYLAVTEYRRWYLAVLILGKGFRVYQVTTIDGDSIPEWCCYSLYVPPEEIASIKMAARMFWESYVEPHTAPPVRSIDADCMDDLYTESEGKECDLQAVQEDIAQLMKVKEEIREKEMEEKRLEASIKEYMQDSEIGYCDGYRVLWKSQERSAFDTKRFTDEHKDMDLSGYFKTTKSRPFRVRIVEE